MEAFQNGVVTQDLKNAIESFQTKIVTKECYLANWVVNNQLHRKKINHKATKRPIDLPKQVRVEWLMTFLWTT
jgi:hypothetical protein